MRASFTSVSRLPFAIALSLALLAPAPLVAAAPAPPAGPQETVIVTPPDFATEEPVGRSLVADGEITYLVEMTLLYVPLGAIWETSVDTGTFNLRVESGVVLVTLGAGAATAHLYSDPFLGERWHVLAAGEEVALAGGDWLAAETGAALAVRNAGRERAGARFFRVTPLHPPIAPELV